MCSGPNTKTTSEEICPRGGPIHNSGYQPININRWDVSQSQESTFKTTLEENWLGTCLQELSSSFQLIISLLIDWKDCVQPDNYIHWINWQFRKLQSAYHANCSTETALLKVKTDLLSAIDNKEVTCLILLNLSAAFDTVNYTILLNRLKYHFGFSGTALSWICLCLTGRTQKVVIGGLESGAVKLTQGAPQGSVLGPVLFTLNTSPLGNICWQLHINFQCYADDQQNYLSFQPSRPDSSETCLTSSKLCNRHKIVDADKSTETK